LAIKKDQEPNKVEEVKTNAAAANSIPALRAEVVRLAEALEQALARIDNLEKRQGLKIG